MKIKLLVYFVLGIILYVYGQKIMRKKLIEVTNETVYSKRMEIVKCLLRAPYNKFEEIEKGRIESTLNNDTETIICFITFSNRNITHCKYPDTEFKKLIRKQYNYIKKIAKEVFY